MQTANGGFPFFLVGIEDAGDKKALACGDTKQAAAAMPPSGPTPDAVKQTGKPADKSLNPGLEILDPVECQSGTLEFTLNVVQPDSSTRQTIHKQVLAERYRGSFHIGVLSTKLHATDYGLRTLGGQTTVVNREAEDRGPEYVAMLNVFAIPRYFQSGVAYPGRDPGRDMDPRDRLGLTFSFGLKEPLKRFGLGLSYELAPGLNVVGVHEWLKRDRLDGISAGNAFTGAAADIPLRKHWDKGWSIGLTFDVAYLARVLGGTGK